MPGAHHRIAARESFHVVGLSERFTPQDVRGIPALWDRFIHRVEGLPGRVGTECYGVSICAADPAGVSSRAFEYIACVQVGSLDRVPEGMRGFTVPAGTFAVFVHRGPIGRFAETLHRIWSEWIPAAGLRPTGAPDFERYDDRFRGGAEDSAFEVWVPVARPA